jgi:hypothetical protein
MQLIRRGVRSYPELTGDFRVRPKEIPMMNVTRFLAAAAAVGSLAAPAAAQYYPQPTYPQQYPQYQQQYPQQAYPGTAYGQQGYGYNQGYNQNPVQSIIDSLLGNRYNVTDRQAVSRCASAAVNQAQAQYGGGYGQQYGQQYAQGYNRASALRVTSISDVQRRNNGLRVSGTLGGANGGQYGYQGQAYAAASLSFRCDVAYNGAVTGIRVRPANGYRG